MKYIEIKDRLNAIGTANRITVNPEYSRERNPRSFEIVCNEILDTLNEHDHVSMDIIKQTIKLLVRINMSNDNVIKLFSDVFETLVMLQVCGKTYIKY